MLDQRLVGVCERERKRYGKRQWESGRMMELFRFQNAPETISPLIAFAFIFGARAP